MDLIKYLTVLVVLCLEGGETGGHGGKHHDHVKLHIPEFVHHDRHTKVITIHHHHGKPKKEHHHHHHHHHQKPHIPHGHHYHHHHKKAHTTSHSVTKGHQGHHGHHGHDKHHGSHHGHQGHHSHHGQQGHGHGHHDAPSINYVPHSVPTFEEDYGSSFTPSVPSYGGGFHHTPQVHGITHTVKQVKVYDSLPGVRPGNNELHGYEVTEQGEDTDDDVFTSVNSLQQAFPATYGYLRGAAAQPTLHDPFAELSRQNTIQTGTHEPFVAVAQPSSAFTGGQSFTGGIQNDPFHSGAPAENIDVSSVQTSPEFSNSFQDDSGGEQPISYAGFEGDGPVFSAEGGSVSDESPVTFSREAGIQHSTNTGGVETIEY